jgi:16S rRNA (guanine527-N7)-methyltransferase
MRADPWTRLAAGLASLGVITDPAFEAKARVYLEELRRWNRASRLTGYRSEGEQVEQLILASLLFLPVLPEPVPPLLDIGSGAGVPGLILKLARPQWRVTLVEANRRRANFMRQVVRALDLTAVEIREERAEALALVPEMAAAFRTVTMRAVVAPTSAIGLARPFLEPEGHLVLALGPRVRPQFGAVRRVIVGDDQFGLRIQRAFLIIPAVERSGRST